MVKNTIFVRKLKNTMRNILNIIFVKKKDINVL